MNHSFFDFFRCPPEAIQVEFRDHLPGELSADVASFFAVNDKGFNPSCDLDQTVDYLRYERYARSNAGTRSQLGTHDFIRDLYYLCRPLLPVPVRSILQRIRLRDYQQNKFPHWPVDRTVDKLFEKLMKLSLKANGNTPIPFIWFWPEGKNAALLLTHDVETSAGVAFCPQLMDIDVSFGFRSAFQVVPERRYKVPDCFLKEIKRRGFEVNVHDLNHDGNLFRDFEEFRRRAAKINQYLDLFGTQGFRSGALYRRLDWYDALKISYDMSVPNVAHLDPQGGGCCTIMPYFVGDILEIPVTTTQDYSLFHILNDYSLDLWKKQTEIILKGHGLISLIAHPDYLLTERAQNTYKALLSYWANLCQTENIWAALPADLNQWWRRRSKMELVNENGRWEVRGEGSERATVVYASLVDGRLEYNRAVATQETSRVSAAELAEPVNGSGTGTSRLAPESDELLYGTLANPASALQSTASHTEIMHDRVSLPTTPFTSASKRTSSTVMDQQEILLPAAEKIDVQGPRAQRKVQRPMHVCMVAYTFYESDNRVMRYAETLAKEGHEVEIFALRQGDNPKEETICGVKIYRLQSRLVNERSRFSYLWRIMLFLFRALFHVSKHDLEKKYDLVHVHSVPDFLVFTALVPRLRGTPVILDIHDILPEFYMGKFGGNSKSFLFRLLRGVEWISAKFASHVIIANDIWKERLLSRSVEDGKCTAVLNSPDRSIFQRSPEPPRKGDRFILLYPGTLNWHQGLDIAIEAFGKISGEVPYADFHIYGEGPSKEHLGTLIHERGLDQRVFLHEMQRLRDIARVIETADLGIVPKRKENFGNEAFSTKIFEFMAMGVPVIVSDTRIDKYYFNDSLVRFFRGGDSDDLASCMLDLIQHPEKRRALVKHADEFIAQNDWTVKRHEYLDLVDALVRNSRAR
jgi:glycosyltransferase involved in cell wall biosynthesis